MSSNTAERLGVYGYLMKHPHSHPPINILTSTRVQWRRKRKVGHVCRFNETPPPKKRCMTSLCLLLQQSYTLFKRQTPFFWHTEEMRRYWGQPVRFLSIVKHGGFCGYLTAGWRPEKWVPSTACHSNHVWLFSECNPIEWAYPALNLKACFSFPKCISSSHNAIFRRQLFRDH